ncbi:LLM class flavin-dependent oxidoreductase [Actinospica sp. MGRD01-02]|uniref:LLM class flavin-dependent oxidoreductase n=1 Tax=Actinospica acidithermotolerans TaxID=2828514 RepID=A0A941IJM1_9ACTN|nr:LLM class flavin-dependent oxidoreductase [Actinospica acidithermotolerans]MBR7829619.1 LLM class flavin-dependent oxidoreductase [Actinospica acidithermotolerans]
MSNTPLTILDLVPISSGSTAAEALRNSIELAKYAEDLGYARYWFAEHHLNPGVAGTSPAVVIALIAASTDRIRLGAGAVQLGHRTALSTVEEFGLLDALHPGRVDLGLGRSGGRGKPGPGPGTARGAATVPPPPRREATVTPNGLLLPPPFDYTAVLGSPRFGLIGRLLQQPGAHAQDYAEQIADILALLRGTFQAAEGVEAHVVPGEHARIEPWILGSSAGESAQVAGSNGLRFAANYHVAPSNVVEAVDAYRAAFEPAADTYGVTEPHVSVSADVVVAEDEHTARELAAGYGPWVRSIRTAEGAIPYPTPAEAALVPWTQADQDLVADRLQTQFVGTAKQVADRLETLRDATGADELIVTTITHDHADRVRSFELLAEEWETR